MDIYKHIVLLVLKKMFSINRSQNYFNQCIIVTKMLKTLIAKCSNLTCDY